MKLKCRAFLWGCMTLFIAGQIHAQKQGYVWYFGGDAGLDFNNSPPTVLTDGQIRQGTEGSGAISSSTGELLFYANGEHVWNRKHEIMLHGDDLLGNFSSVNGAVIVPMPGENNKYYIFTTGGFQYDLEYGLRYSIVDMCGDNGYGEVIEASKNIPILENAGEKLAFTSHANGVDYWLVAHEHFSNAFHAYQITENGIASDVVSDIGTYHGRDGFLDAIGQIKISPDGLKLALVMENRSPDVIDLFDFDPMTGAVTEFIDLSDGSESGGVYGVAFSQDRSRLYTYSRDGLYQFSLDAGTQNEIIQSKYELATPVTLGGLQLGPDGRIYVASFDYVSVIENPNSPGPGCNFIENAIYLDGKLVTFAFPTYLDSFDYPDKDSFPIKVNVDEHAIICREDAIELIASGIGEDLTYLWEDGSTGSSYEASSAGQYTVKISDRFCTVEKTFHVTTVQPNDLGPDQAVCQGDKVVLTSSSEGATFSWQDGSKGSSLNVFGPGIFWLDATVGECTIRDSVNVTFVDRPIFSLGGDKSLCQGDTLELTIDVQADSYQWADGNIKSTYEVTTSGEYVASATLNGCSYRDSITIQFTSLPIIDLGGDIVLCEGDHFQIALDPGYSYVWSDGSTNNFNDLYDDGDYWVTASFGSCLSSDTITVGFTECKLLLPNIFTPDGNDFNALFVPMEMSGVVSARLVLYNRWGTEVFWSDDFSLSDGWDGRDHGSLATPAVYFWRIRYITVDSKTHELKGMVTLRR